MSIRGLIILLFDILVSLIILLKHFPLKHHTFNTKKITSIGLLTALVIVLQLLSNYVSFGPANLNLSLFPIIVGAVLYGPGAGLFLGLVNGLIVLLSPSTIGIFMPLNPFGTVLICVLKSSIAGLLAGFVNKLFKRKLRLGALVSSIIVPTVNTGLFLVGFLLMYTSLAGTSNPLTFALVTVIGWNFFLELFSNVALSYVVYRLVVYYRKKEN